MVVFPGAPFSSYEKTLRNGPEQSRARGVGAAKRTLDGEDRSERGQRGKGSGGFRGVSTVTGLGAAPRAHTGLLAVPSPATSFVHQSQPCCTLRLTHRFPRGP